MAHEEHPVTLESLDPALQADVDQARVLANQANAAFDQRRIYAGTLAAYHANGDLSVNANPELLAEVDAVDRLFGTYKMAAEALMPPRAAFENTEPIKMFATEAVWNIMSPEQQVKAVELRAAIAASPLSEYGVTEDSLRVVMTGADGDHKKLVLVHMGKGVDIGNPKKRNDRGRNYEAIMSHKNDELFQVEVDGVTYDTRTGMTLDVYSARIEDARERGATIPDSLPFAREHNDYWAYTILTGEPLQFGERIPAWRWSGGRVDTSVAPAGSGDIMLRVRPAVEIQ